MAEPTPKIVSGQLRRKKKATRVPNMPEDGDIMNAEVASETTMAAMDDMPSILSAPDGMISNGTSAPESPVGGSKKEKERRVYRVGLSYACKHCGQPKKGHKCTLIAPPGDGVADPSEEKPIVEKKRPAKDPSKPADEGASKTEKTSSEKRPKKEAARETPQARTVPDAIEEPRTSIRAPVAGLVGHEDAVRLAELLEFNNPLRPPSLITPEDVEAPDVEAALALSSMSAPPASFASAPTLFSPSQFITMMGTPAPAITPGPLRFPHGLSPGALLGNLSNSPLTTSSRATMSYS